MIDGAYGTLWGTRSDSTGVYDWVDFHLRERYLINKLRIRSYDSYGPKNIKLQFSSGTLSHKLSQGESQKLGPLPWELWEDIQIKSTIVSDYLKWTVEDQYVTKGGGRETDTFLDEIQVFGCHLNN